MDETIDCDYISREQGAPDWKNRFADKWPDFELELHVPCRDPIDHILSQCNHVSTPIPCNLPDDEYYAILDRCLRWTYTRFKFDMLDDFPDGAVKCFNFHSMFTTYISYMDERLQKRRMVSEPYIERHSNKPRNDDEECLLKDPELMKKTRKYLLDTVEYYQYCESCLGSENDLLLGLEVEDEY